MDASSARVTAVANLGPSAVVITAAPTPRDDKTRQRHS
jgi:hypothetical protein